MLGQGMHALGTWRSSPTATAAGRARGDCRSTRGTTPARTPSRRACATRSTLGVRELTVYSFSTENWSRPPQEVDGLMAMFARRIASETPELHEEGVRMRFIGRREGVSADLVQRMDWAQALTDANDRITLFVAFNYGGRAEIVDAARAYTGGGEEEFRKLLYAPEMHDPDLIIRTSGERRLSNYLLWQSAYSELVFRDELWPDFTREALEQSLAEFSARRRASAGADANDRGRLMSSRSTARVSADARGDGLAPRHVRRFPSAARRARSDLGARLLAACPRSPSPCSS